ncbi:MAG: DUF4270 family protein [Raineya sp.]|nr:DUF4270 domain-containing protein [Raineya sp.]MDW8296502.1 DUF4270 family protein [Raineya sp.]
MNLAAVKNLFYLCCVVCLISACNKSTTIGSELQPQNLGVIFTDTVTVEASTIFLDSVATTNREIILAGEYIDPFLGHIKAASFFNVQPFNKTFSFGSNPQFISAVFSLPINFVYGDSTQTQTLSLHRLTEKINPNRVYYNYDMLNYEPTPVGTYTFVGTQAAVFGKIEIPLDDNFRNDIIALVNANANDELTQAELDDFVKGFALVSQGGNAIWGFRVTDQIPAAIEIKFISDSGSEQIYRIAVRNAISADDVSNERYNSQRFNHVSANRAGTPIQSLTTHYQTIPSAATNEMTFIQESLGIRTKVTFPYLKELVKNRTIAINKADLVVFPVENTHNQFFKLPRRLDMLRLDENGKLIKYFFRYSEPRLGQGVFIQDTLDARVQAEGNNPFGFDRPFAATFNSISNSYNMEITTYLQYVLNGLNPRYQGVNKFPNSGFILSSDLSNTAVFRMIVSSSKRNTRKMQLRIFYTIVK